jgi:hypothetical protein
VVFRDFFTAGLRLPVSKKFSDILSAYNVQIHQLTPNSIPQVLKFLWACCTFAGDNDVDAFVRHFEIHWARKLITVDDEEKRGSVWLLHLSDALPWQEPSSGGTSPSVQEQVG